MNAKIMALPLPFVTNVIIDARADDVEIRVDPALIFDSNPIAPGERIPDDQEVGVSVNMQKGSALSFIAVIQNDKAVALVEALVTCIVRGDPKHLERAEALLAGIERAITTGLESPARLPGQQFGCIHEGGDNSQPKDEQGQSGYTSGGSPGSHIPKIEGS